MSNENGNIYINRIPITEEFRDMSLDEVLQRVKEESAKRDVLQAIKQNFHQAQDGIYLVRNGKISRL